MRPGSRADGVRPGGQANPVPEEESGYLTGRAGGRPVAIARAWIGAHRRAFGLSPADVRGLAVTRDYVNPASRTHVITFTQVFGDAPRSSAAA